MAQYVKLSEIEDGEMYQVGKQFFTKGVDNAPKLHPMECVILLPLYCILIKKSKTSDWEIHGKAHDREFLEAIVKAEVNNHMVFTGQVVDMNTDQAVYWI